MKKHRQRTKPQKVLFRIDSIIILTNQNILSIVRIISSKILPRCHFKRCDANV